MKKIQKGLWVGEVKKIQKGLGGGEVKNIEKGLGAGEVKKIQKGLGGAGEVCKTQRSLEEVDPPQRKPERAPRVRLHHQLLLYIRDCHTAFVGGRGTLQVVEPFLPLFTSDG